MRKTRPFSPAPPQAKGDSLANKERAPGPSAITMNWTPAGAREMLDGAVENGEGNPEENAVRQKLWGAALAASRRKEHAITGRRLCRAVDYHEPVAQDTASASVCVRR